MRILSLDISSKTGWAILEDGKLITYGRIDVPCEDNSWPLGIHTWAKNTATAVFELIQNTECEKIVIERANSSRFRSSQNFLDWIHYSLIDMCINNDYFTKLRYTDSAKWRRLCEIKLNSEQKKQNKLARQASKAGEIYKVNGKRVGKKTKKHLAVDKCNELFDTNFILKDNDIAESCLLGYAYFKDPS